MREPPKRRDIGLRVRWQPSQLEPACQAREWWGGCAGGEYSVNVRVRSEERSQYAVVVVKIKASTVERMRSEASPEDDCAGLCLVAYGPGGGAGGGHE